MARLKDVLDERERERLEQIGDDTAQTEEPVNLTPEESVLPKWPEDMRPGDNDPKNVEGLNEEPQERAARITENDIPRFEKILRDYEAGKAETTARIKRSESWWRLHNTTEERKLKSAIGQDGGFTAKSAWLHNLICNKHADAMEAYPEPVILPREKDDKAEATILSKVIPTVLEQNNFEDTYNREQWQKDKTGTGLYKVMWDHTKLNGLGDIAVERVNLLNVFSEPGVEDIQKSEYFFHVEEVGRERLEREYPQIAGRAPTTTQTDKFAEKEQRDSTEYTRVVEVYYHKDNILHYCKYTEGAILAATENDMPEGLYKHGKYPFVFDPLFPVEDSPYGYGYVDLAENAQTYIDILQTAMLKNAVVGAVPRYFMREDGGINEAQFLDLSSPTVRVPGGIGENDLREIPHKSLDGAYLTLHDDIIRQLRETSGNTETASGTTSAGVTAASAIAALQSASGKGSRDAIKGTYRAYKQVVELCIELIRQFYDMPRWYRIIGPAGMEDFIQYSNKHLQLQQTEGGARLPVFDIKVTAQKQNAYDKLSQNELAIQLYQMGAFDPKNTDQILMMLDLMDFEGLEELRTKIERNGTLYDMLQSYMSLALELAKEYRPELVQGLAADITQAMSGQPMTAEPVTLKNPDDESKRMRDAREQSLNASQPTGGKVVTSK